MCGVLPGGKSITVKRVPLAGGAVPRMRAPMSSIFSPIGIFAGAPSVHHIMVETSPACGNLALVAGASRRALATQLESWPVTTRRIDGYFGFSIPYVPELVCRREASIGLAIVPSKAG